MLPFVPMLTVYFHKAAHLDEPRFQTQPLFLHLFFCPSNVLHSSWVNEDLHILDRRRQAQPSTLLHTFLSPLLISSHGVNPFPLVGEAVGLVEWTLVGEDKGLTKGAKLGLKVRTSEGDADGSDVGDMLGIKLPRIVGAMLGVSVTRTEQNEQQSHVTSGEYPPQSAFTSAFPHCKIVPVSILLSRCKCINLVRSNTGTDPVSALLFSQLYERSRFASSVGIVPPRPDKSYKYSSCSCDNWPNSDGIDPVMPTSAVTTKGG